MKKKPCKDCKKYLSALIQIAEVLGMPRKREGHRGCSCCKCEGCEYEHVEAAWIARDIIPENLRKKCRLNRRWRPIGKGLGHECVRLRKKCEDLQNLLRKRDKQ